MTTPLSVTLSVLRERNYSIAESTQENRSIRQIEGIEDIILIGVEQVSVRVEAVASLVASLALTFVHAPWEILLLNRRISQERGLISWAALRVNALFVATIILAFMLQAGAILLPELGCSWLKLHVLIDHLTAALLSELPASLKSLGERMNADFSTLIDLDVDNAGAVGVADTFRGELRAALLVGMSDIYTKRKTSSFAQFDWALYLPALRRVYEQHDEAAKVAAAFMAAESSIQQKFCRFMKECIQQAKEDLIAREIFYRKDFLQVDGPAEKAAEFLAVFHLQRSAREVTDGYLLRGPKNNFFIGTHSSSDPLKNVVSRGFGVAVSSEGLTTRLESICSLIQSQKLAEKVRDLLQEEYVDESELRPAQTASPIHKMQDFFREVAQNDSTRAQEAGERRQHAIDISEDAARKRLIQQARAMMERQNARLAGPNRRDEVELPQNRVSALEKELREALSGEELQLLRRALFYGLQVRGEVSEKQKRELAVIKKRFAKELLREVPAVLRGHINVQSISSKTLAASITNLLRSYPQAEERHLLAAHIASEEPANAELSHQFTQKVQECAALKAAYEKIWLLNDQERSFLYRLLSPRRALDPAKVTDTEVRQAYLHVTTLTRLIKTFVIDLHS